MFKKSMNIADYDPVLWQAIQDENRRQEEHIELIASENYASPRVMEAQGSQFTTSMLKAILVNVTTAVVSTQTLWSSWQLIVLKSCLVLIM